MSKIIPFQNRVVIKQDGANERSGSLYIPDMAKEKQGKGTVISVGLGKWNNEGTARIPMQAKEGDRVVFNKAVGSSITVNNEEYLVLKEDEIIGSYVEDKQETIIGTQAGMI